jgi:hypothetical protein
MRRVGYHILLLAICCACGVAKDETVAELKARFESAHLEDRADLGIRIAFAELRSADKLYQESNVEQAQAAVGEVVSYAEKAGDAATQTKKRLKNVEIDVRKMADKLRDIKRTVAFEDQSPIDQAVHRLEDLRTALLKEMFAVEKKKDKK